MLKSTRLFVRKFMKDCDINTGNLLDVGSFDEGSGNLKADLAEFAYTGLDMRPGKNVDMVMNAHNLKEKYGKEEFDVVLCIDTLEHDDKFWVTIENMKYVLKKGGWLVLGTPSINHGLHRHPKDYWRFTEDSFKEVLLKGLKDVYIDVQYYEDNDQPSRPDQIFGWGRK